MIPALGVALLLLLIALGMPIAFALAVAGSVGLYFFAGLPVVAGIFEEVAYAVPANYVLLTIPMFVLMSEYLSVSNVARDLVDSCDEWLGRLRGGLGFACVAAGALMAAVIGSSTAAAATMSTAAYPNMKRLGYQEGFAVGVIAIAGTLSILIPPSIVLIIYGVLTEESIGKLLIAGIVPGILTAVGYVVTISLMVRWRPELAPRNASFDLKRAMHSLRTTWAVVLLMVIVIGSLYSGIVTPTEVGAIGAASALVIISIMRRVNRERFVTALRNTARTTVMILLIIIGAIIFGYFMTYTQLTQNVVEGLANSGMTPWTILLMVLAIYLVLGMFLDQFAILVLTVPITYALVTQLGFDGIWFGIIITKTVEIGLVSPPLGLNVFISSNITGVPLRKAFIGVLPFIVTEVVVMGLLLAFPELTLYLPNLMR